MQRKLVEKIITPNSVRVRVGEATTEGHSELTLMQIFLLVKDYPPIADVQLKLI